MKQYVEAAVSRRFTADILTSCEKYKFKGEMTNKKDAKYASRLSNALHAILKIKYKAAVLNIPDSALIEMSESPKMVFQIFSIK